MAKLAGLDPDGEMFAEDLGDLIKAGLACCHAGGRVKPVTGDSPPFDPGSP
jgi:hypothetical protein